MYFKTNYFQFHVHWQSKNFMKFSKFFYVHPKPRPEETCISEVPTQNVNLTTFCHLLQKTWLNFLLQCHDNSLIVPEFPLSDIAFYPMDFIIRMLYYIYQYSLYNNHCILSTNKSVFNRMNHIPHHVQVSTF